MSYSDSFPAVSPTWQCNFASNGGRLDPRITFSRSDTPPTYAAPSAVHYWSNEKHESSQNLVAYSSDVSNSYWTKDGVTPTGGQTAPDGGTDAYKLTESSVSNEHRIYHTFGATPTDETTITLYAKYIGRQWIYVRAKDSGGTNRYCWFDIQNGVVGTVQTNITATIAASGNGYYKCTVVLASAIASGQSLNIGGAAADGDGSAYTGSGADAFALWGINMSTLGEKTLNETSGQIHREYAPTLKSVSTAGQPRFEYSPTDSASMGLLIEGSSTNLLNRSEEFDNAYWSKYNTPVTANAAVAPSGQLAADLLVAASTGSSTNHYAAKSTPFTNGTTYTLSVYAKAAGYTKFNIRTGNPAVLGVSTTFTLTGSGSASVTSGYGKIEACGNGWFRCSVTETAASTNSTNILIGLADSSGNLSFDGDDYSGVLLWGAQLEQASFASSYIKVEGSTATRASDSAAMVNSSLFDNGGGTLYAEASRNVQNTYNGIFSVDDGTGSNIVQMFGNSNNFRAEIGSGGTTVANMTAAGNSVNTFHKHCVSFSPSEAKYFVNGSQIGSTDTDLNIPTMSQIHLGELNTSGNHLNGHIKRVAVYSEPVSATNAAALTS